MKILVISQYYSPEPFRITDICEELVRQGHEVLVVTGIPNYPEGKIYPDYRRKKKRNEIINGVRVHRCFTVGRRSGALFRFLNYYSYSFSSAIYTARLREKFDVVFVNQLSPVMMAKAGIGYKKKHQTKMVLYCMDLWPESLTVGGVRKGSILYRYFYKVSAKIYAQADRILVSSRSFSKYFQDEFGISDTLYLPQYAETLFCAEQCQKQPDGKIDVMFAGNIGTAQSVDTIIWAAHKTKNMKHLYWHIVGDGSELSRIKALSESLKLTNVVFHGRQTLEAMPKYYSMADAMLVTMQRNDIISMTLPGKVQTYMAAGKPILGAIDGETASIITDAGCGLCCKAEDADGLADIVEAFIDQLAAQQYGNQAADYYRKVFSKDIVIEKLVELLSANMISPSN